MAFEASGDQLGDLIVRQFLQVGVGDGVVTSGWVMVARRAVMRGSALFRWTRQMVMNAPKVNSRSLPKWARGIASPIHLTGSHWKNGSGPWGSKWYSPVTSPMLMAG